MTNLELKTQIKQKLGIRLSGIQDRYLYKNIHSIGDFTISNFARIFDLLLKELRVDYNFEIVEIYNNALDSVGDSTNEETPNRIDLSKLDKSYKVLTKEDCIGYTNWCTLSGSYSKVPFFIVGKNNYMDITLENSSNTDYQNSLIYVMYSSNHILSITGRLNHNYAVVNTDFYLSIKQLNNLIGDVINEKEYVKETLSTDYDYINYPEYNYIARPITNIFMAYNKFHIKDLVENPDEYTTGEEFVIPPFTTKIYKKMFSFSKLKQIILPDSIVELKDDSFANSSIEHIEIPLTVKTIPQRAFWNYHNLKEITLHDEIKSVKKNAFVSSGVKELRIPSKIKQTNLKWLKGVKKLYLSKNTSITDKYKVQVVSYYDSKYN